MALTKLVAVIATVTRFVSEDVAVTTRLLLAVSVSIAVTIAVVFVTASSRIVFAARPVKPSSRTGRLEASIVAIDRVAWCFLCVRSFVVRSGEMLRLSD